MAKQALAAGRRDEATVHAWNALTTAQGPDLEELARVAEELGDQWLLRELELRRITAPAAEPEPEPRRRVPWGALVVGLVILAYWIIASRADEPGAVTPTARDTVAQSGIGSHQMTLGPGIYLLALGRLETIDLPKLSGELSLRYHLPIEILPPLPVTTSTLDSADHALDADRLLDLIAQSFHVKARTTIIGLTDYELYSASIGGRYPFSLREPPHYAVVSTADLGVTTSCSACRATRATSGHESWSRVTSASCTSASRRSRTHTACSAPRCRTSPRSTTCARVSARTLRCRRSRRRRARPAAFG